MRMIADQKTKILLMFVEPQLFMERDFNCLSNYVKTLINRVFIVTSRTCHITLSKKNIIIPITRLLVIEEVNTLNRDIRNYFRVAWSVNKFYESKNKQNDRSPRYSGMQQNVTNSLTRINYLGATVGHFLSQVAFYLAVYESTNVTVI